MNSRSGLLLVALCVGGTAIAGDPAVKNARHLSERIDKHVEAKLKAEKIPASPAADDAEFLRRACLDISGVIPTVERAKAFLDDKDPAKRAKLIDELLASPEYGRRMADVWTELLLTRTSDNRRMQPQPFIKWLTDEFNAGTPWNKMTTDMLTASGPQDKNPAVTFFLANESVDKMTDNVSRNLLGIQLQCAQCHNHPFTGWKQTEYWGMAAFFMKVRGDNVNKAAKDGGTPGVSEGPQINRNKKTLPESAKIVPARFLQGEQAVMNDKLPYRPVLASWITDGKNPFFARAMANRVWAMTMGRGLVNPVDDMHENNPASHPELLGDLAQGFQANGFDVKELIRGICNSKAYQRTSKPIKGNEDAEAALYSRMNVKVLTAEMLHDSIVRVSGPVAEGKNPAVKRGPARSGRDAFVAFFRADEGTAATEYTHGIPQALRLMNSAQFNRSAVLDRLVKGNNTPDEIVEQLYLIVLSRRPTSEERTRLVAHIKKGEARQGCNDILWALLNCSEFALNR